MARFKYLNKEDVAPEHREHMRDINLTRLLFHNPEMARAHSHTAMYIRFQSKLDPRLREMAILQVGYCARSPYEWSHHVKIGFDFGVSEADIRALIDDSEGRPTSLDPSAAGKLDDRWVYCQVPFVRASIELEMHQFDLRFNRERLYYDCPLQLRRQAACCCSTT